MIEEVSNMFQKVSTSDSTHVGHFLALFMPWILPCFSSSRHHAGATEKPQRPTRSVNKWHAK